jgi:hypothetical protein
MIPALVLFCSTMMTPDACTEQTAFDAISRNVSPIECVVGGMNAQLELADDPRGSKGIFVKLVCSRPRGGSAADGE